MTVAKILEITSESEKSFQDAIESGIKRAGQTVKGIRGAWIKDQQVQIKSGKITAYRVDMKITFVLKD